MRQAFYRRGGEIKGAPNRCVSTALPAMPAGRARLSVAAMRDDGPPTSAWNC
jgi:hypothetical protein